MDLITKLLSQLQKKRLIVLVLLLFSVQTWALNDSIVYAELQRQQIVHPEIVLVQAKLETGNYTSQLCRKHGNLFGIKGRKGYQHYSNWKESVSDYKKLIQSRYKGGDYYEFLRQIKFAEDKKYIIKLKRIVKINVGYR